MWRIRKLKLVVKREKVFSLTNITLPENKLWMIEQITSFIVTLDGKPTNAITSDIITYSINEIYINYQDPHYHHMFFP